MWHMYMFTNQFKRLVIKKLTYYTWLTMKFLVVGYTAIKNKEPWSLDYEDITSKFWIVVAFVGLAII